MENILFFKNLDTNFRKKFRIFFENFIPNFYKENFEIKILERKNHFFTKLKSSYFIFQTKNIKFGKYFRNKK